MDIFDQNTIDNVISIINNLVYNGNNETTEEIDNHLKNSLKPAFIDFFGKDHEEKISSNVDNMKIYRLFHIIGSKNSISSFLEKQKIQTFNEGKNPKLSEPEILNKYFNTPIESILKDANNNSSSKIRLEEVCNFLHFKLEDLQNPDKHDEFYHLLYQAYYNDYLNTPYSRDEEKNQQYEYLKEYYINYSNYLYDTLRKLGKSKSDYMNNEELIIEYDPIFKTLTKDFNPEEKSKLCQNLLLPTNLVAGFNILSDIYLGLNPDPKIIVHETFHAILYNNESGISGIDTPRFYAFNEAITEYYSRLITEKFFSKEENSLTSFRDIFLPEHFISNGYEPIVKPMEQFLKLFTPEIKNALMSKNPIVGFIEIIGRDDFSKISDCLDIILISAYGANANRAICEINQYANEDASKVKSYLQQTLESNERKKSALQKLFDLISIDPQGVSNALQNSKHPQLLKIASTIYSYMETINSQTQKKVNEILNSSPEEKKRLIDTIKEALLVDNEDYIFKDLDSLFEEEVNNLL